MYLVAIIIFSGLILSVLFGILIFQLFFNKKTLVVIGEGNIPNEILKVSKKKGRLFGKNFNLDINQNYIKSGGKIIYFAEKKNENTFIPHCLNSNSKSVDNNILNGIASAYEIGSKRFQLGLEGLMPFISVVMVALICIIGVSASVKYSTDITPIEADMFEKLGDNFEVCASYVSESQKTNLELAKELGFKENEESEVPK